MQQDDRLLRETMIFLKQPNKPCSNWWCSRRKTYTRFVSGALCHSILKDSIFLDARGPAAIPPSLPGKGLISIMPCLSQDPNYLHSDVASTVWQFNKWIMEYKFQ